MSIIPGSITFIPDLDYTATGSISISSSTDFVADSAYDADFSWTIEGVAAKDLDSSWSVGSGEYYWYRVEGVCEKISCDNNGVKYDGCKGVFLTTVAARSVSELCEKLKAPSNTPSVVTKIKSIKKYSRPVMRAAGEPECNTLSDQDFCQVLECADYCLSESVVDQIVLSMWVVDSIKEYSARGGVFVSGSSELDRLRIYNPEGSEISLYGNSDHFITASFYSSGSMHMSGKSRFAISHRDFISGGSVSLGGAARFVSPRWTYVFSGGIEVDAPIDVLRTFSSTLSVEVSGSSSLFVSGRFVPSGSVEVYGVVERVGSPIFNYSGRGGPSLEGALSSSDGSLNFQDLGTVFIESALVASVFGLASDINDFQYSSTLTISDQTISPACGCGPIGLSLPLSHNLGNSFVLSNFLNSNSLSLDNLISMGYKSVDRSWRSVTHFSGRGKDGVSLEDWSLFFSLACLTDTWRLSFIARAYNRSSDEDISTKLILNMPADAICSDNKIATDIRVYINSGELVISKGKQISAVTPARTVTSRPAGVSVTVDGSSNDYVLYYDNLGLFKNSYWTSVPFEIKIDPAIKYNMPLMNLNPIFR